MTRIEWACGGGGDLVSRRLHMPALMHHQQLVPLAQIKDRISPPQSRVPGREHDLSKLVNYGV
ncbi:hypothetical protein [Allorhodopirellula heiligendammensis]|uniref:hypothetical protein n=1 Tax=Allorhodopirellula heiligendammensis TaxID=2714739 RepID=UPI00265EFE3D|nr:hypothetical protein [Allorhodopirellula heiligendammensis]